jgi:hypothetical protein
LLKTVVDAGPPVLVLFAMALWQLGEQTQARGRYDQTVRWGDTNSPADEELCRLRAEVAMLLRVTSPLPAKNAPGVKSWAPV